MNTLVYENIFPPFIRPLTNVVEPISWSFLSTPPCIAGNQVTVEVRKHQLLYCQDFVISLCHHVMHLHALQKGSICIVS